MLDAGYIGDELTGAGFALAGVHTHTAPESVERLWRLLLAERERRQLVILSADCGQSIRQPLSDLLDQRPLPPVLVLPDPASGGGPDDVVGEALEALGVEATPR